MKITDGSIEYQTSDGINYEKALFTYDENEKQENEINKANAKLIFSPEFVPYYIDVQEKFQLTMVETLVYGFIRFYMKNASSRFYFTNEQLGDIIGIAEGTVNNVLKRLSDLGLIEKSQKVKAGGGTIRFITRVHGGVCAEYIGECIPNTLPSVANNNKIKENKINVLLHKTEQSSVKGNPDINFIIEEIKSFNNGICDGTIKEQRNYGKHLLNKLQKIELGEYNRKSIFSMMLNIISKNTYHSHKISGPKKIYYELTGLLSICKQEFEKQSKNNIPFIPGI